ATAAFAAQPPLTTKNPLAWTLPSGCGNSSTRNTSSSTMMPAHRMCGARSADDIGAILDIAADNVMGNRNRRRSHQPLRMLSIEHQSEFFAIEPARVFEFVAIDDNFFRQCLDVAAYHNGRRKRPWLRSKIAYPPASNANFLENFAPHGFFDAF